MDKKKLRKIIKELLLAVGENPSRDGLRDTPEAVSNMLEELFAGINKDTRNILKPYYAPNNDELIIVKDIPFYSLCEHHLLPFFGVAHIAYIPRDNLITGFGDIAKLVDVLSKRPTLQESLTTRIADVFEEVLHPKGVLVVLEAEHLCVTMRGIKKPGTKTVTSAMRGWLRNTATRSEAFSLIKGKIW